MPHRFFVRTLTRNDVKKLHGARGTFEPDLGETARDTDSSFWGWPDKYRLVTRTKARLEWKAKARLSSSVRPGGSPITVTLWAREPREDHLPEHRFGLGPIGRVRGLVPADFDTSSLVVLERSPDGSGLDYLVRFITHAEPDYRLFEPYLTEEAPEHRYGYGP